MSRAVIIEGDGIGPEVIASAVQVLEAVAPGLDMVKAEMGMECCRKNGSYLPQRTVDLLNDSDAGLFGAITSPSRDPDYRSPLLFLRKSMDLYANVRPVKRLHPSVGLVDLDIVIVRENTEGMYSGMEREVPGGIVTERMVTESACRRIVNKAIELCRSDGRKKVTCVHKCNVLRRSDGLFRDVFLDRMKGSGLEAGELLVDAAAAAMVLQPDKLDYLVTLNLYGDILSDEAAALVGGLGFAPSVNLGERFALFEPTHGSAPDIAGKDLANPIAAILSAAMMLRYLGMNNGAERTEKAVPAALGMEIRTRDAGGTMGTREFTRNYLEVLSSF